MSMRAERAIQHKQNIIDTVLLLSYQGQPFYNISFRQLASEVGLVQSALYRYFPNKDLLAQATIDQVSVFLKSGLFQARSRFITHEEENSKIRLIGFFKLVEEHALYWNFFASERLGGYPILEQTIEHEIEDLTTDFMLDLRKLPYYQRCNEQVLHIYADILLQLSMVWSKKWITLHKIDTSMSYEKNVFLTACFQKLIFLKQSLGR